VDTRDVGTSQQSGIEGGREAPHAQYRLRGLAGPLAAGALAVGALGALAAAPAGASSPARAPKVTATTVDESLVVLPGAMTGHPGWPEFVGSKTIQLPADATVVLTIYSYDTGPSPLAKGLPYDKVSGTVGGTETVNGSTVSSVANADLAHTFTVPGLGLNIAIPAAKAVKKGEPLTPTVVTATFTLHKAGTYTWQCYAPCGSGANGEGGPMMTPGYMTGKVVVG
jgi:hypothetical protein